MRRTIRGRSWDLNVVLLSVATVAVALFLWNAPLLLPVKLFVVLLHELGHALAALLTGGNVERLVLLRDEGGLAFTRGGNRFLILSAGYLGSALWGALLMRLAWASVEVRRYAIQGIGAALVLVLLLYTRDPRTLLYVGFFALALFAIARWAGGQFQMAVLWLLGSFSCLYAVIDIGTDVLARGPLAGIPFLGGGAGFSNDAELLASITLVPAFVWGLLWSALALAIFLANVATLSLRQGRRVQGR